MPLPQLTLELRGILRDGRFQLLRVHELQGAEAVRRKRQRRRPGLAARLVDEHGTPVATGAAGLIGDAFRGVPESGVSFGDGTGGLLRMLLPLVADDVTHRDVTAELVTGDTVIWRAPVAPDRPRVEARAELTTDGVLVRWATDAGPVDVLAVSPDGRIRVPILRAAPGDTASVGADRLPGGPVRVQVRAVAGLRESYADAGELRLPDRPGALHAWLERDTVPAGQPVTAFVSASDSWGRPLPADHTRWDLDGTPLGSGAMMLLYAGPGEHRVTAGHPDGGEQQLTLTVTEDPPGDEITRILRTVS
jgi:hypothetical protein